MYFSFINISNYTKYIWNTFSLTIRQCLFVCLQCNLQINETFLPHWRHRLFTSFTMKVIKVFSALTPNQKQMSSNCKGTVWRIFEWKRWKLFWKPGNIVLRDENKIFVKTCLRRSQIWIRLLDYFVVDLQTTEKFQKLEIIM